MLSQVMQDAINEQINNEMYSSYLYLAMSAYCEQQQLTGCARWQVRPPAGLTSFDDLIPDENHRVRRIRKRHSAPACEAFACLIKSWLHGVTIWRCLLP